jgi:hypothetical protein
MERRKAPSHFFIPMIGSRGGSWDYDNCQNTGLGLYNGKNLSIKGFTGMIKC